MSQEVIPTGLDAAIKAITEAEAAITPIDVYDEPLEGADYIRTLVACLKASIDREEDQRNMIHKGYLPNIDQKTGESIAYRAALQEIAEICHRTDNERDGYELDDIWRIINKTLNMTHRFVDFMKSENIINE